VGDSSSSPELLDSSEEEDSSIGLAHPTMVQQQPQTQKST
jgi:hypothetical protein